MADSQDNLKQEHLAEQDDNLVENSHNFIQNLLWWISGFSYGASSVTDPKYVKINQIQAGNAGNIAYGLFLVVAMPMLAASIWRISWDLQNQRDQIHLLRQLRKAIAQQQQSQEIINDLQIKLKDTPFCHLIEQIKFPMNDTERQMVVEKCKQVEKLAKSEYHGSLMHHLMIDQLMPLGVNLSYGFLFIGQFLISAVIAHPMVSTYVYLGSSAWDMVVAGSRLSEAKKVLQAFNQLKPDSAESWLAMEKNTLSQSGSLDPNVKWLIKLPPAVRQQLLIAAVDEQSFQTAWREVNANLHQESKDCANLYKESQKDMLICCALCIASSVLLASCPHAALAVGLVCCLYYTHQSAKQFDWYRHSIADPIENQIHRVTTLLSSFYVGLQTNLSIVVASTCLGLLKKDQLAIWNYPLFGAKVKSQPSAVVSKEGPENKSSHDISSSTELHL